MSEMWTDGSDPGDDTDAPYGDDGATTDYSVATEADLIADVIYEPDYAMAEPVVSEPWTEPVSCCDCSVPGWEGVFYEQVSATPEAPVASVVATPAPTAEFSSWAEVSADPQASVVSVGQPVSSVAQPDWTIVDNTGQTVDPSTLYPTTMTIGGQSLEPAFTIVQPALEPTAPTGMMTIGGTSYLGDFTITDGQGNPVDPAILMPGSITIGGPNAGLSNLGSSPTGALQSVLAAALEKGDAFSAAMLQGVINSQNYISAQLTAPDNVVIHRYL